LGALRKRGLDYKVIRYGSYTESVYKKLLSQARLVVWLGRHESQGIALEEPLACGAPVLVCDVNSVGQWVPRGKEIGLYTPQENLYGNTTAAPYFDETCGVKIKDLGDLPGALAKMENGLENFRPRQYIQDHLSLEGQAREFVEIYNQFFGLSFRAGLGEQVINSGGWQSRNQFSKLKTRLKAVIKGVKRGARL
jgi:glycosyltransferase involved in cell wall biosynthesis